MIWNLLGDKTNDWQPWVLFGIIIVALVVFFWLNNKKGKQRQQEYTEQLEAIAPGHKVKTIGGLCGIVTEVCDDNTVIIQTGSEKSGSSYFKLDKECIAQTDAKGPTQIAREQAEAQKAAEKLAKKEGKTQKAEPEVKEEAPAAEEGEQSSEKSE